LRLDIFQPAGPDLHTAVLHLHGGGWRAGSRAHVHGRCWELAQHGFTSLAAEYRLLPEAPWPAPITDVHAAITWVADNCGRLDIDPGRIVLQGYSAGAHLALLAGTKDHRAQHPPVAAIVAAYPVTDFHPTGPDEVGIRPAVANESVPAWLLFDRATTESEARAASPLRQLDANFPPTLIYHGTNDRIRPHTSSVQLHAQLLGLGVPADLMLYSGQGHEFDYVPSYRAAVQQQVAFFLRRTVADRQAIEAEAAANNPFAHLRTGPAGRPLREEGRP
jgi:acetyl esterase/lipase